MNLLLLLVAVVVGGLLATGTMVLRTDAVSRLGLAALSAALIGGAANSINDYFDLEIDRINRPNRPLPAAQISPSAAKVMWAAGSAAGLALSLLLSLRHVVLATVAVVLLYLYNVYWKRRVLTGNLAVAFMTALALVYGAWAVGDAGPALVGAAFAFLTTLAREVIKDIEDVRGDSVAAARTVAVVWGPRRAARIASGVLALTVLLTPLPYLLLEYGGLYLLVVLASDVLMLYAIWCMQRPAREQWVRRASAAVKGAMAFGIAALVLVVVA
ncbi:MAG TPA: UbiA family prenyltransferase [Rhodothermales bacterium]|nr:UbiA family prenyltransferase [Rhodothermales bacterium]